MRVRAPVLSILLLAAIYFGAAKVGFAMALSAEQVTLVWPPTGLALGALLVYGIRWWPGIFLGAFLANASTHEPLVVAGAIAAGNTLAALVAVWLLRWTVAFGTTIERVKHAVAFVLCAAGVGSMVSASIGVTSLCASGLQPWSAYQGLWWTWWLGDAAGYLLVGPALLTWGAGLQTWRGPRRYELATLAAALLVIAIGIFGGWFIPDPTFDPLEYAVFPFVIWAAIRFGVPGVTMAHALVAVVAIWGAVRGPSALNPIQERLVLLQIFLSVMAATGLFLGAAITERDAFTRRRHAEYMVTLVLGAVTGVNEAIRQVLQIACAHLDWDVGLSWRVDQDAGVLYCDDVWAKPPQKFPELERISRTTTLKSGSGLPGRVWLRNEPCWMTDAPHDADFPRVQAAAADGLRGAFLFPIGADREVLGVFEFFSRRPRPPDADLLQMFSAIGTEVGQFVARKRIERLMRESEARKTAVLEAALDCIITIDSEGRIVEFNPAAERTFGYRSSDVLGMNMATLLIPEALRADYQQALAHALEVDGVDRTGQRFETTAHRADGTEFPVELSLARTASLGQPLFTAYLRDITEQKQMVKQLAFRATHDGLTQTLNRASLIERLREATERSPHRKLLAVLFVDMDGFKDINDRMGHLVGDRLLVAVARRLQASVRPADAVGRLGGDEFAILLEHVADLRDATSVADRVQESLAKPFDLDGHQIVATASIGVTLTWAGDSQPEDLLRAADAAMYAAKATGPGRYRIIDRRDASDPVPRPGTDRSAPIGSSS